MFPENCFSTLKEVKVGSHKFSQNQKKRYRLFPMISGHGTEKLTLSMGFEIVGHA